MNKILQTKGVSEMAQTITNIQQARAIIKEVGEKHQYQVSDQLRGLTYQPASTVYERDAQAVISNMEHEYVLNVANELWVDKYDQIPEYIKNYTKEVTT